MIRPVPLRIAPTTVAVSLAATCVAVGAGYGVAEWDPSLPAALILGIGLVVALPLVVRAASRLDVFEPYWIFGLAYGVMFVLRPAAMLVTGNFAWSQTQQSVRAEFVPMLVLALLGGLAFVIGYHGSFASRIRPSWRTADRDLDWAVMLRGATAWGVVGALLFGVFLSSAGGGALHLLLAGRSVQLTAAIDSSVKYFYYGPLMIMPAVLLYYAAWLRFRRPGYLVGALLALLSFLVYAGPLGSRGSLLPLVGAGLVLTYLHGDRRPRVVSIAVLAAIALAASYVLLQVRYAGDKGRADVGGVASAIVSRPQTILDPLLYQSDAEMAPALAAAMSVVPSQIHHTWGMATFGDLVTRPLPRKLWSHKPLPPRDRVIETLEPANYAAGNANPEFSALLVWYMDFGYLGALALVAYGALARIAWQTYRANRSDVRAWLLLSLGLPFLVLFLRDSPVDTLMRAAFIGGPLFLSLRLGLRHQSR